MFKQLTDWLDTSYILSYCQRCTHALELYFFNASCILHLSTEKTVHYFIAASQDFMSSSHGSLTFFSSLSLPCLSVFTFLRWSFMRWHRVHMLTFMVRSYIVYSGDLRNGSDNAISVVGAIRRGIGLKTNPERLLLRLIVRFAAPLMYRARLFSALVQPSRSVGRQFSLVGG